MRNKIIVLFENIKFINEYSQEYCLARDLPKVRKVIADI